MIDTAPEAVAVGVAIGFVVGLACDLVSLAIFKLVDWWWG
jgi:hypothetical protein